MAIVKQFSSGGTVVVDHSLLWTTFIGQTDDFLHVSPYPKDIIRWSAEDVFGTVFQHMGMDMGNGGDGNDYNGSCGKQLKSLVMDTKSCGLVKLKDVYGSGNAGGTTSTNTRRRSMSDVEGKKLFFEHVKGASADAFELEEVTFVEALEVMDGALGGFQICLM